MDEPGNPYIHTAKQHLKKEKRPPLWQPRRARVTLYSAQDGYPEFWCGREDSNLHGIATASPSSWCVCQFRHCRTRISNSILARGRRVCKPRLRKGRLSTLSVATASFAVAARPEVLGKQAAALPASYLQESLPGRLAQTPGLPFSPVWKCSAEPNSPPPRPCQCEAPWPARIP
jgi:hypothetical protein